MSDKSVVAVQGIKAAQAEMVQWENRLEFLRNQHESLVKQNQQLESEIASKRTDYELFMSTKDAEVKQGRERLLEDQRAHTAQKLEFVEILKMHQHQKQNLEEAKKAFEDDRAKLLEQKGRIDQFVIALQRAYSLIG